MRNDFCRPAAGPRRPARPRAGFRRRRSALGVEHRCRVRTRCGARWARRYCLAYARGRSRGRAKPGPSAEAVGHPGDDCRHAEHRAEKGVKDFRGSMLVR